MRHPREPYDEWMEIAALVLEYIKALAWPVAAFAIAFMFRSELRDLVDRVTHFKGPGFEADIAAKLERVVEKAETIQSGDGPVPGDAPRESSDSSFLGQSLSAWSLVEFAARDVAALRRARPMGINVARLFHELSKEGLVDPSMVEIAEGMQGIRNDLVHRPIEGQIDKKFVDSFVGLCEKLRASLEEAREKISEQQAST